MILKFVFLRVMTMAELSISAKIQMVDDCTNDPYEEKTMQSEVSRIHMTECDNDS